MSTATSKFAPTDGYLRLIRQFPLRPTRNEGEY